MVGGNLYVANNLEATVVYYYLKNKDAENGIDAGNKHARTLWSELNITF